MWSRMALARPSLLDTSRMFIDIPHQCAFCAHRFSASSAATGLGRERVFLAEFLEITGVSRSPLDARIQDPGAARLQLSVRNLETALQTLSAAGPSTVVSTGGRIIQQPGSRVVVVSDLNGLFLVLTDRQKAPRVVTCHPVERIA